MSAAGKHLLWLNLGLLRHFERVVAEGHGTAGEQHSQKIPRAGPDDRELRGEGVRIDDRRDGIRRVVEPVDEFDAQGDQPRHPQQQEGQQGPGLHLGLGYVGVQAVGRIQQSDCQKRTEQQKTADIGTYLERA